MIHADGFHVARESNVANPPDLVADPSSLHRSRFNNLRPLISSDKAIASSIEQLLCLRVTSPGMGENVYVPGDVVSNITRIEGNQTMGSYQTQIHI